jgi:hypothetical protein
MGTSPEPGAATFSLTHFRIRAQARGRQATAQPPSKTKPRQIKPSIFAWFNLVFIRPNRDFLMGYNESK